ncbi:ubiquitin-related domain-containing protein [Chlamydoabsidia padenii]|nr:ubiquitin-related domain-containing protein [Chlamydoabsidia padenii]
MSPTTPPMTEMETPTLDDTIPHATCSVDGNTTSLFTSEEIPLDKCRLTLLLVSGKRQSFEFDPHTMIDTVKTFIMNHWPQDWAERLPPSIDNIEFVYLGKFLDNHSKLKDNGIAGGHATIVHLVIRQHIKKADDGKWRGKRSFSLSY